MTKRQAQKERIAAAAAAARGGSDEQGSSSTPLSYAQRASLRAIRTTAEPPIAQMASLAIVSPLGQTTAPGATRATPTAPQVSPFPPTPAVALEPSSNVAYATKLAPARVTNGNRVELISNFYDIHTRHQMVYRYDVSCKVHFMVDGKLYSRELTGGPKNDACKIEKSTICVALLQLALQGSGRLLNNTGLVHDGASQAYLSTPIKGNTNGSSTLTMTVLESDLPSHVRKNLKWIDIKEFEVKVEPNTKMPSFDIGDYSNESGVNLEDNNKDVTSFLNLLTSQKAREYGFSLFGTGKLFNMNTPALKRQLGQELRNGVDKGIKFIENGTGNGKDERLMAALLLDAKGGNFFIPQVVKRSIEDRYGRIPAINWEMVNGKKTHDIKCAVWKKIKEYVTGMRIAVQTKMGRRDFQCTGLSTMQLKDIMISNAENIEISLLEILRADIGDDAVRNLNSELPALRVSRSKLVPNLDKEGTTKRVYSDMFWPIDHATVMANQRVPIAKQLEPPQPIKPYERFGRISRLMGELHLDGGNNERNEFLDSFGVTISPKPKIVVGVRREAPSVSYEVNNKIRPVEVDRRANWSSRGARAVERAGCDTVVIGFTIQTNEVAIIVRDVLTRKCREFGVAVKDFKLIQVPNDPNVIDKNIMKMIEWISNKKEKCLFILIDDFKSKTHPVLKLSERKFEVATLQLTSEVALNLQQTPGIAANIVKKINCKLGGLNYTVRPESLAMDHWINTGDVLIIGYDIAHPEKPDPNGAVMVASTVGFSFNAAVHPEAFIGDFHYQYPLQEQVDSDILVERMMWILSMFEKNRKTLPKKILVIRDGVSEGQYPMVMRDELGAIKKGCSMYAQRYKKNTFNPKLGLIIATKRHAARFGMMTHNNTIENVTPLTVIDRQVTRPNINEFYGFSSHPPQGTAKSVCYQLLVNDFGFKNLDECQALVMALTFHHQIVDKATSLPEPVYQADEWAKRGSDLWKAYNCVYDIPTKLVDNRNIADFALMTKRLALKGSKLEGTRVNA